MSILSWLTDQLVLQPSNHPIESDLLERKRISTSLGSVESWVCRSDNSTIGPCDLVAIKFPGTGGRAELSSPHPFELWEGTDVDIWTINHHGYGNSSGNASLQHFSQACDSVWSHLQDQYHPKKIVVIGNSLGCLSALYLSARFPVAGLYLRNPVPLAQMIETRRKYNVWNLGLAKWIAHQVPTQLDAVENAKQSVCPALFIQSENDRVVPEQFQRLIIDSYSGPSKVFTIHGADHHHKISPEQECEYVNAVEWLEGIVNPGRSGTEPGK